MSKRGKNTRSISVTRAFHAKLQKVAEERGVSMASIIEAAVDKDLSARPSCWCGVSIDPGNDCCRAGHRVFDDDGEPLSTQTGMRQRDQRR